MRDVHRPRRHAPTSLSDHSKAECGVVYTVEGGIGHRWKGGEMAKMRTDLLVLRDDTHKTVEAL